MERNALEQKGLSPKLLADIATSIVLYVILAVGLEVDKDVSAAIAKVIGFAVGAVFKPGRVVVEDLGPPNDDILPAGAVGDR